MTSGADRNSYVLLFWRRKRARVRASDAAQALHADYRKKIKRCSHEQGEARGYLYR